jgi:hypothetical protein
MGIPLPPRLAQLFPDRRQLVSDQRNGQGLAAHMGNN